MRPEDWNKCKLLLGGLLRLGSDLFLLLVIVLGTFVAHVPIPPFSRVGREPRAELISCTALAVNGPQMYVQV
jgi:hypothetical protein